MKHKRQILFEQTLFVMSQTRGINESKRLGTREYKGLCFTHTSLSRGAVRGESDEILLSVLHKINY